MTAERLKIHPDNPQPQRLDRAAELIASGAVVAYPTDSCYALGCHLSDAASVTRIRRIRQTDKRHFFTLVCRDLSEIATYARVNNQVYRLLRKLTPGPYTWVLRATGEVPKKLTEPRRKTIGIRVPAHPVAQALLERHGAPLISTTLQMPGDDYPLSDPDEVMERLGRLVDVVIDSGSCHIEPSSVIDLTGDVPNVIRAGLGDVSLFE